MAVAAMATLCFTLDAVLCPRRAANVFQPLSAKVSSSAQAAGELGHLSANDRERREVFHEVTKATSGTSAIR